MARTKNLIDGEEECLPETMLIETDWSWDELMDDDLYCDATVPDYDECL